METTSVPRWRTITFYILAALALAMILGLLWFLLTGIVLAWFPVESWEPVFDDIDAGDVVHRIHFLAESIVFWGLAIGIALQLWKPARRQAPMLQALAVALAFLVIGSISGSLSPEEDMPFIVVIALLALLHPAREGFYRFTAPDPAMTGLAVLAAVPGAFFMLDQIDKQRLNLAGDEHAELAHWSLMAVFTVLVVLWGLIGATDRTGWRVTAWVAGVAAATYGIGSLVFPLAPSAVGPGWAIAAVCWGTVYVGMAERRARSGALRAEETVPA